MENFEDAKLQEPFLAKIQSTKVLLDGLKNTCQDIKNYEVKLDTKILDSDTIEKAKKTALDVIQQESNLKDLIACISSSIGEMEDLFKNFVVDENQENFCPNYKFKLNETLKEMANSEELMPENDFRYIHLEELLVERNEEFTEISNSQIDRIPIDPFTQIEIQDPVRNKICHHVYDKSGIFAYINQAHAAKKKTVKCPTLGCSNSKTLSFNDIIEDTDLKARIESLKHNLI